ncbi:MAG TPA: tetratricopeptide repeat protein [Candidatus Angelobacter sp.]|nr:tetratricopeptide repeat protein [Candidatus Angelobacter sp.]
MQSYTRRQLKEDKFASTAKEAVHWASDHRRNVIYAVSAVLVIALAVVGYIFWNSRQTEQASILLGKAAKTFSAQIRPAGNPAIPNEQSFSTIAERAKQAEKEFKAIADQFPHTKPGKFARYMEGSAAMQAGETANAEKLLKSAADSGDKDVAPLAKVALASLYIWSNRTGDAANIYKDLSDHPSNTVSKSQAQLLLAEMYESTDPKLAATIYQQVEKENPNTAAAQIARSKNPNPPPVPAPNPNPVNLPR